MDNTELLASANDQLPHGAAFRLIHELVNVTEQAIHCRSSIRLNSPLVDATGLPILATIEYAAQAAAVHGVLIGRGFTADRPAFVGAVRDFGWQQDYLVPAFTLDIYCTLEYVAPTGAIYCGEMRVGEQRVSWGRLTLVRG